MSRPKEFDRAEALTAAKAVFWRKGYDATTTDDLRHAMSIGRQSLYDSDQRNLVFLRNYGHLCPERAHSASLLHQNKLWKLTHHNRE